MNCFKRGRDSKEALDVGMTDDKIFRIFHEVFSRLNPVFKTELKFRGDNIGRDREAFINISIPRGYQLNPDDVKRSGLEFIVEGLYPIEQTISEVGEKWVSFEVQKWLTPQLEEYYMDGHANDSRRNNRPVKGGQGMSYASSMKYTITDKGWIKLK